MLSAWMPWLSVIMTLILPEMAMLNLDKYLLLIGRCESEAVFRVKGESYMSADRRKKKTLYTSMLI